MTPQIDNPDLQDIPMREAGYGRSLDLTVASSTTGLLFERRLLGYLDGQVTGPRTGASSSVATFPVVR